MFRVKRHHVSFASNRGKVKRKQQQQQQTLGVLKIYQHHIRPQWSQRRCYQQAAPAECPRPCCSPPGPSERCSAGTGPCGLGSEMFRASQWLILISTAHHIAKRWRDKQRGGVFFSAVKTTACGVCDILTLHLFVVSQNMSLEDLFVGGCCLELRLI